MLFFRGYILIIDGRDIYVKREMEKSYLYQLCRSDWIQEGKTPVEPWLVIRNASSTISTGHGLRITNYEPRFYDCQSLTAMMLAPPPGVWVPTRLPDASMTSSLSPPAPVQSATTT